MAKRTRKKSPLKNPSAAQVAVVMGSTSDLAVMQDAIDFFKQHDVDVHVEILSAHRTPERMLTFAINAAADGLQVIIAAAGGAAHLPGMIASATTLPVIGVPIKSKHSIQGIDSLLSIAQMPGGVPVATMAIDGALNAAILALQILALSDAKLAKAMLAYKRQLQAKVEQMNKTLGAK